MENDFDKNKPNNYTSEKQLIRNTNEECRLEYIQSY
jgi:hypothetical protein